MYRVNTRRAGNSKASTRDKKTKKRTSPKLPAQRRDVATPSTTTTEADTRPTAAVQSGNEQDDRDGLSPRTHGSASGASHDVAATALASMISSITDELQAQEAQTVRIAPDSSRVSHDAQRIATTGPAVAGGSSHTQDETLETDESNASASHDTPDSYGNDGVERTSTSSSSLSLKGEQSYNHDSGSRTHHTRQDQASEAQGSGGITSSPTHPLAECIVSDKDELTAPFMVYDPHTRRIVANTRYYGSPLRHAMLALQSTLVQTLRQVPWHTEVDYDAAAASACSTPDATRMPSAAHAISSDAVLHDYAMPVHESVCVLTPKELLFQLQSALCQTCVHSAMMALEMRTTGTTALSPALYTSHDPNTSADSNNSARGNAPVQEASDVSLLESYFAQRTAPARAIALLAAALTEGRAGQILTQTIAAVRARVTCEQDAVLSHARRSASERDALQATHNAIDDLAQIHSSVTLTYRSIFTDSQAQRLQSTLATPTAIHPASTSSSSASHGQTPPRSTTVSHLPSVLPARIDTPSPRSNVQSAELLTECYYNLLQWILTIERQRVQLAEQQQQQQLDPRRPFSPSSSLAQHTSQVQSRVVLYEPETGRLVVERAHIQSPWGLLTNMHGSLIGIEAELRNASEAGEQLYRTLQSLSFARVSSQHDDHHDNSAKNHAAIDNPVRTADHGIKDSGDHMHRHADAALAVSHSGTAASDSSTSSVYASAQQEQEVGLPILEVNRRRVRQATLSASERQSPQYAVVRRLCDGLLSASTRLHLRLAPTSLSAVAAGAGAAAAAAREVLFSMRHQGGEGCVGQRALLILQRTAPSMPWGVEMTCAADASAVSAAHAPGRSEPAALRTRPNCMETHDAGDAASRSNTSESSVAKDEPRAATSADTSFVQADSAAGGLHSNTDGAASGTTTTFTSNDAGVSVHLSQHVMLRDFAPTLRLSEAARNFLFEHRGRLEVLQINYADTRAMKSVTLLQAALSRVPLLALELRVCGGAASAAASTPACATDNTPAPKPGGGGGSSNTTTSTNNNTSGGNSTIGNRMSCHVLDDSTNAVLEMANAKTNAVGGSSKKGKTTKSKKTLNRRANRDVFHDEAREERSALASSSAVSDAMTTVDSDELGASWSGSDDGESELGQAAVTDISSLASDALLSYVPGSATRTISLAERLDDMDAKGADMEREVEPALLTEVAAALADEDEEARANQRVRWSDDDSSNRADALTGASYAISETPPPAAAAAMIAPDTAAGHKRRGRPRKIVPAMDANETTAAHLVSTSEKHKGHDEEQQRNDASEEVDDAAQQMTHNRGNALADAFMSHVQRGLTATAAAAATAAQQMFSSSSPPIDASAARSQSNEDGVDDMTTVEPDLLPSGKTEPDFSATVRRTRAKKTAKQLQAEKKAARKRKAAALNKAKSSSSPERQQHRKSTSATAPTSSGSAELGETTQRRRAATDTHAAASAETALHVDADSVVNNSNAAMHSNTAPLVSLKTLHEISQDVQASETDAATPSLPSKADNTSVSESGGAETHDTQDAADVVTSVHTRREKSATRKNRKDDNKAEADARIAETIVAAVPFHASASALSSRANTAATAALAGTTCQSAKRVDSAAASHSPGSTASAEAARTKEAAATTVNAAVMQSPASCAGAVNDAEANSVHPSRVSVLELTEAPPLVFDNSVAINKFDGERLHLQRHSATVPWNIKISFIGDDMVISQLPPFAKSARSHPYLRYLSPDNDGRVRWVVNALNGKDVSAMSKSMKTDALSAIRKASNVTFMLRALRK